jgi:CDP-glucose 4,6-dehydratase
LEDLALSSSFWRDKRVLITGHTGFKGAWLSIWLQRLGASIAGYALPATTPNLFVLAGLANSMQSEFGDVRDLDHLSRVVADFRPHIIIHMAAQSLVRPSYTDPVETFGTNVMGTVNILESARQSEVRAVVNVTTDKCYENVERDEGYREDEPLGGHDPYSSSKAGSEIVTSSYRRSFSLGVASARAGNVIGGGDWAEDRLLPDMMRAFVANEAVAIRNPASTRPWQHVLEPLSGYLLLAERLYENTPQYAEAWNFGPDDSNARPVEWLADRVCDLWGPSARWSTTADENQPHEAQFLRLNCDKARSRLGWRPRMNIEQALAWTVQWYKAFQQGDDVRMLTETQITKYETGKGLS